MDFSKFDTVAAAEAGAAMPVKHPGNDEPMEWEGVPITWTLRGSDSESFQTAVDQSIEKNTSKSKKRGGGILGITRADQKNDLISYIVACNVAWSDGFGKMAAQILQLDGEFPCTAANARAILTRVPWLREQANAWIGNRANFLPEPETP